METSVNTLTIQIHVVKGLSNVRRDNFVEIHYIYDKQIGTIPAVPVDEFGHACFGASFTIQTQPGAALLTLSLQRVVSTKSGDAALEMLKLDLRKVQSVGRAVLPYRSGSVTFFIEVSAHQPPMAGQSMSPRGPAAAPSHRAVSLMDTVLTSKGDSLSQQMSSSPLKRDSPPHHESPSRGLLRQNSQLLPRRQGSSRSLQGLSRQQFENDRSFRREAPGSPTSPASPSPAAAAVRSPTAALARVRGPKPALTNHSAANGAEDIASAIDSPRSPLSPSGLSSIPSPSGAQMEDATAEALRQLQQQHALVMLEIDLLKKQVREKSSVGKHRRRRSQTEGPHTPGRLSELRGTPRSPSFDAPFQDAGTAESRECCCLVS